MANNQIDRIIANRDELTQMWMLRHGATMVGEAFEGLVDDVCQVFHLTGPRPIRESLLDLFGQPLTLAPAKQAAWRLAANIKQLRQGIVVPPWQRQLSEEWVPVQIVEIDKSVRQRKSDGKQIVFGRAKMTCLSGLPAGLSFAKTLPHTYVLHNRTTFGFSRYKRRPRNLKKGKYFLPFVDIRQLTRFRFQAHLTPESCSKQIDFEELRCPAPFVRWNRGLLLARYKIDPPCPNGWTHDCHSCSLGYDQCVAACHPAAWQWKPCHACNRDEAPFVDGEDRCVNCAMHN